MKKETLVTEYLVFHLEWIQLKETMSKKAWDELENLIFNLRLYGVDTDPSTIKNKVVKGNWTLIRKQVLNSMKKFASKKANESQNNTNPQPIEESVLKVQEMSENDVSQNFSELDIAIMLNSMGIDATVEADGAKDFDKYEKVSKGTKGEWNIGEIIAFQHKRHNEYKLNKTA